MIHKQARTLGIDLAMVGGAVCGYAILVSKI